MTPIAKRLRCSFSPKDIRPYSLFWAIAAVTLLLDQSTKIWISKFSGFELGFYPPHDGWVIIPNFFNIVYAVNYGAAWGMFAGFTYMFISLAVIVLFCLFLFRKELELHTNTGKICFGLITGGIIGNTIDRIAHNHVIDFLDFNLLVYRWPTFNVADSALVIGSAIYLLASFRSPKT